MSEPDNTSVAARVADVTSFDPGLGSYSFTNLGEVVKFADLMSHAGEMLPEHLRNKPALCMAVTMRATHWGFDPFALAMETYQAKNGGPIGYQAKVFTAALRNAGVKLRYRYEGKVNMLDEPAKSGKGNVVAQRKAVGDRKCIAYAEVDGEVLEYETMTLDQITIKNSPQWHNDPDQQLAYAAGRGWARRYRSDTMMGAYSDDEVESMKPMRDVTPDETPMQKKIREAREAQAVEPETPDEEPKPKPEEPEDIPDAEEVDEEPKEHWTASVDTTDAFPGAEAFTEGVKARQAGMKREMCPHNSKASEAVDWLGGWDQADGAAE